MAAISANNPESLYLQLKEEDIDYTSIITGYWEASEQITSGLKRLCRALSEAPAFIIADGTLDARDDTSLLEEDL
ncbi:MAG: hypothetical protein ACOX1G_09440 [bacterium]|jgi:hypothetical protein